MGYYIDLFSGCGGLSLGLRNAGWRGLFAIEKDVSAFTTLKYNLIDKSVHFDWPEWLSEGPHDIDEVLGTHREKLKTLAEKVELVAGGPPCQGFSVIGRRNEKDKRNKLVDSYINFIALVKPRLLFFENVKGFTMEFVKSGTGIVYSNHVSQRLRELGYNVDSQVLNFADFGIPQRRVRYILVGTLKGKAEDFFTTIKNQKQDFLESKASLYVSILVKKAGAKCR